MGPDPLPPTLDLCIQYWSIMGLPVKYHSNWSEYFRKGRHTYFLLIYFFLAKNVMLCILKDISPFKMHKIIFFARKPDKNNWVSQVNRVGLPTPKDFLKNLASLLFQRRFHYVMRLGAQVYQSVIVAPVCVAVELPLERNHVT